MTTHRALQTTDLQVIADQVWASFLDTDGTAPLDRGPGPEPDQAVSAAVSVTGAWHGHVVLGCSDGAARHVAAALLGIDGADVTEGDTADALGELANVIGGNVKSLLPGPSALSLPHVVTMPGARHRWPAAVEVCRLAASWRGEPISIAVLESSRTPGEDA